MFIIRIFFTIIGLFIFLSIVLTSYFCPFSETMFCDQNYNCTVKQEFIFNIKKEKEFKVNTNSIVNIEQKSPFFACSRISRTYYFYPVYYTNNKKVVPFIGFIDNSTLSYNKEELNEKYDYIDSEFQLYLKNPSNGYYIQTDSNGYFVIILILVYVIGIPLWYFFEVYLPNKK